MIEYIFIYFSFSLFIFHLSFLFFIFHFSFFILFPFIFFLLFFSFLFFLLSSLEFKCISLRYSYFIERTLHCNPKMYYVNLIWPDYLHVKWRIIHLHNLWPDIGDCGIWEVLVGCAIGRIPLYLLTGGGGIARALCISVLLYSLGAKVTGHWGRVCGGLDKWKWYGGVEVWRNGSGTVVWWCEEWWCGGGKPFSHQRLVHWTVFTPSFTQSSVSPTEYGELGRESRQESFP